MEETRLSISCVSVNTQRWHTSATRDLMYTSGLAPLTSLGIRIGLGRVMSGLFLQKDRASHTNDKKEKKMQK